MIYLALIGCDSGNVTNSLELDNDNSQAQSQASNDEPPVISTEDCELSCERSENVVVVTEFCEGVEVGVEEVSPSRAPIGCFPETSNPAVE